MNDTLSFTRLSMLIKKHWQENRKLHALSLVSATGVLVIFYLLSIMLQKNEPLQEATQFAHFVIGLGLVYILYSLHYFNGLTKKEKATTLLLLPASHLEKLLCAIFYCTILTTIVWFGIFYLVNTNMVALLNKLALNNKEQYIQMYVLDKFEPRATIKLFTYQELFRPAFCICLTIQAVSLLGSFFFNKFTLVKTIVIALLVWAVLISIQNILLNGLMPIRFYPYETGVYKSPVFTVNSLGENVYHEPRYIFLSPLLTSLMRWGIFYLPWPLFTLVTYFRLKEKAV